jgi:hypothetical protein
MRSEVLVIKITLFWDDTIQSRKDVYQCSGGTRLHLHEEMSMLTNRALLPLLLMILFYPEAGGSIFL